MARHYEQKQVAPTVVIFVFCIVTFDFSKFKLFPQGFHRKSYYRVIVLITVNIFSY